MPESQLEAVKIGASEHEDVSVELWPAPTEPPTSILSFAAGNAHFVVTLRSRAMLGEMRDFIVNHRGQTKAEWLEIGTFATCPVNVCSNKNGISLICDGQTVVGYPESFAIYFAGSRLDWLCRSLGEIILLVG